MEDHLKIINKLRHDVDMQVGQLQAVDSMTCGEDSIGFLYFAMEVFHDVRVWTTAASIGETPDQLITDFVYSGRFKVQKPALDDVDEWLYKIGV